MYLPSLAKKPRKTRRDRCNRHTSKLRAKNRRRRASIKR